MSAEDYLLLRSSALFSSKTWFCPSKAIIESKLLIILICGVFVYWSSTGARDDRTHFPLRKSHLRAVTQREDDQHHLQSQVPVQSEKFI